MRKPIYITRFILVVVLLSLSLVSVYGQNERLTLAEVLTGLQAKSANISLAEKNAFITTRVRQRGVTFPMSTEIRNELQRAGASIALLTAIRSNGPKTLVTRKGNADGVVFDKLWVTYNVTENGKKGLRVHTKFTLKGMKEQPLQLSVRFQKGKDVLMAKKGTTYRNKGGQLAVFRALKPAYESATYKDYSVFLPYSELDLPQGTHNLQVDADLIYTDGTMLKHLKLHPFVFKRGPAAVSTTPAGEFTRIRINHNVTVGGKRGMRVLTDFVAINMVGKNPRLVLGIEKADKTIVRARTRAFRSKTGQLTVSRKLNVRTRRAVFKNVQMFFPYSEFGSRQVSSDFRIHADILHGTSGDVHLTFYNFTIPRLASSTRATPTAALERISIVPNVRVGGRVGMYVDVDFNVQNLSGQQINLAVFIQDSRGRGIRARSAEYRLANGSLGVLRPLNPEYDSTRFRNQKLFIPYDEFAVARGVRNIRAHVDVLYGNNRKLHLANRNFTRRF